MGQGQVVDLGELDGFAPADGVLGRAIFGRDAMLVRVDFEPGAVAPPHVHEQEQFGYVITGELSLVLAGQTHTVGPGQGYYVPPGVTHSAVAGPDGSTGVEVFSPIRADYRDAFLARGEVVR